MGYKKFVRRKKNIRTAPHCFEISVKKTSSYHSSIQNNTRISVSILARPIFTKRQTTVYTSIAIMNHMSRKKEKNGAKRERRQSACASVQIFRFFIVDLENQTERSLFRCQVNTVKKVWKRQSVPVTTAVSYVFSRFLIGQRRRWSFSPS